MTDTGGADLAGLARLGPALADALGDASWRQADAMLISGGKSNLTFMLRSPTGEELILRRPPTGDLLPSAHDMIREARVQRQLAATAVPVAEVVLTDPGELIGVPCYVMRKVPGHIVRDRLPAGYATTAAERHELGTAFVDTLAAIHAVDVAAAGLSDYGRPDGFLERQVRRWTGQWTRSRASSVPEVDELGRRLATSQPESGPPTIVHGDYRLDNVILNPAGPGISAVLDWELSTLGDPLADVAMALLFWREAGETAISVLTPHVTDLRGFPTRAELIDRYSATTGRDLDRLDYYLAFSHFKMAVICQGVAARADSGAMGGQDFGDLGADVRANAAAGLALLS